MKYQIIVDDEIKEQAAQAVAQGVGLSVEEVRAL